MTYLAGNDRASVHIVMSDRGWIIEEMAQHLVKNLSYVTADTYADPTATIQYYMTYSARTARISPVEVALFTHREDELHAARRFDETAKAVDHAIAMANATNRLIEQLGVQERSCISPGVDLDLFSPKLKIAVVGRTYHTGRKGEALVRAVMDIPDIDWHFTGEGWPGPALKVPQDDLPAFYRSMDYVLVPATNEGGPMSVLEALACGTPVIASDVGWVGEFPHIAFERGSAESLREVLERLRAERFALRDNVATMTWQRWVEEHDALFARLAKQIAPPGVQRIDQSTSLKRVRTVGLVTHGAEDTTLGGPSVRVPRTQKELERLNLRVTSSSGVNHLLADADVVHGFNIWTPNEAYRMARQVKRLGCPFVFSPILLDLSESPFWGGDLLRAFRASTSSAEAETRLDHAFARFRDVGTHRFDFEPGYSAALAAINEIAAATIFLSDHEQALFKRVTGIAPSNPHLIRNPVDASQFDGVSPDAFREAYGLDDYVLCVGRIEHRKNQLMLANALASTNLPLVLIGHQVDVEYSELIRRFGGSRVHIIGRLDPGSTLLRSAMAGARVFALPSWAEGAPLAALEAGAAGVPLVLSDRSGEREYFGDQASYCDPGSCASIRQSILEAWDRPFDATKRDALRSMVAENYNWSRHVRATQNVYEAAVKNDVIEDDVVDVIDNVRGVPSSGLVFDVTTWFNNCGTLSGIVRVESVIAAKLVEHENANVKFIVFSESGKIISIPNNVIRNGFLEEYRKLRAAGFARDMEISDLTDFSDLVVVGSSWMQNSEYSTAIAIFAEQNGLNLNVLMHDFTPHLFPQWYMNGYASVWTANCRGILARANRILVYSDSTARDVERFCFEHDLDMAPLARIRLADEIGAFAGNQISHVNEEVRARFATRPFVLAVGAIHVRKNYSLLFDVWTMLRDAMGADLPHLVIVGGTAWNGEDVSRAIREDPRVRNHIHILEGIDDHTLAWLYENCLFTTYPSLYEGWGLPVGESLARGKICLSSNISSMVEIAPSLTDLLPPLDRNQWAARIEHYARSAVSREQRESQIRQNFEVTSWASTASDVLAALHEPASLIGREVYVPGAIALCKSGLGARYLDAGWHQPEDWGVWSSSKIATLRMRLAHRPNEDMMLTLIAQMFKHPEAMRDIAVVVNGVLCGNIGFFPENRAPNIKQSVARIRVPREIFMNSDSVIISFEVKKLEIVSSIYPDAGDNRALGIGLSAFILENASLSGDIPRLLSTRHDVREILGVSLDQDLDHFLGEHPSRPSARAGHWHQPLGDFVRHGTMSENGAVSSDGLLALAIGTTRLHPNDDVMLNLAFGAMPDSTVPFVVSIFVNDQQISSSEEVSKSPYLSLRLSKSLLGRSDPLQLVIIGSEDRDGTRADFVLHDFRLLEAGSTSLCTLSVGHVIELANLAPEVRPLGDRMGIPMTFQLALPMVQPDSVLVVDAGMGYTPSLEINGVTISAEVGGDGRTILPLGCGNIGAQEVNLTLLPNASMGALSVSDLDVEYREYTIAHHLLPTLGTPEAKLHRCYLFRDGWNEVESNGWCWGAADRVSFWVRPESSGIINITCEIINEMVDVSNISLRVDGVKIDCEVIKIENSNRIVVKIHNICDFNFDEIVCFEIYGLTVNTPFELGMSDDRRNISIAIVDISQCSSIGKRAASGVLRRLGSTLMDLR